MKKLFLLSVFIASITFSFAQHIDFGIKGGVNFSTQSSSYGSGSTITSSNITGFHAGGFVDIGLGSWSVQPALLYSTKGGESTYYLFLPGTSTSGIQNIVEKNTFRYIELPVNILYHVPFRFGKVFLGAGPYIAMGISKNDRSTVIDVTAGTTTTSSSEHTYGASGFAKNPDFGVDALGGIRLSNGLLVSVGYDFGLANLSGSNGYTLRNNSLNVSVGFSW